MSIKEIKEIIFSIFKPHSFRIISPKKILLSIVLLVGLGLLLYQSLLGLQLKRSRALRFCFSSQKRLADYQKMIIQEPKILLAKIEAEKNKLKNLEKRFVPEREIGQVFNDLKGLISVTENHLESLDIRPLVYRGTYQELPFSISVKGHYVDIILLLNKLEGYPQLIDIADIKIRSTGVKPSEVLMSLEARLFVSKG